MMNEIINRGPIVCAIKSTAEFHQYTSGIFIGPDVSSKEELNHAISVVGWGEENG